MGSMKTYSDSQIDFPRVEKGIREYQRFGRTNPGLVTGPIQPDPLFRRLSELREKLGKLQAEFWDGYPEVLLTKGEIASSRGTTRGVVWFRGPQAGREPA